MLIQRKALGRGESGSRLAAGFREYHKAWGWRHSNETEQTEALLSLRTHSSGRRVTSFRARTSAQPSRKEGGKAERRGRRDWKTGAEQEKRARRPPKSAFLTEPQFYYNEAKINEQRCAPAL